MTEEDAKTKWCPFARSQDGDNNSGLNRGQHGKPDHWCLCLASQCMAWRWSSPYKAKGIGYCGLAGKPS